MQRPLTSAARTVCRVAVLAVAAALMCGPAVAQLSTATITGTVVDHDSGRPIEGATVTALESASGFHYAQVTSADGSFVLAGLRPGKYTLSVQHPSYAPAGREIEVTVGQTARLEFRVSPQAMYVENVNVVGERVVEIRSPEVSTTVTPEQIEALPQPRRNFLDFAGLAPGIRVTGNEENFSVETQALGQRANTTNVFIDGGSFKNDVLEGGVVGQDASRGNPFPQNAVQEFRVVTQNFKAEYERSSTAIITATTKSGTNLWTGNAFLYYIDKGLSAQDDFSQARGEDKPSYERFQGGVSVGGPIIKDKLHIFASIENNRQDRASSVILGNQIDNVPTSLVPDPQAYVGSHTSPFRSTLAFTKLSWQPRTDQTVEFSYFFRHETDKRGFGNGQDTFDRAENVKIDVNSFTAKHQLIRARWLNEASVQFQRMEWNPTALNFDAPGQVFEQAISIGGRSTSQDFTQDRLAFRDDFTFHVKAAGDHTFKAGVVASIMKYDVTKELSGNPEFFYAPDYPSMDTPYAIPYRAVYGVGNPDLSSHNNEYGVYFQDDWNVSNKLQLNLGVRWDYETDMLNNNYVTPQEIRDALADYMPAIDTSRYFTDGSQRDPFYSAIQPRVGFSYDFRGDGKSVLFGGWGRYYDRTIYNYGLDERYRLQFRVRTFCFVPDADTPARPGCTSPPIVWDPSYLSRAALDGLIANGVAPNPEIFLIDNNTEPPYSDQWSIGVRHAFGNVIGGLTYSNVRSFNGFTFVWGNSNPDGSCCAPPPPGYGNILLSSDAKRNWYDGVFLTAERPLSVDGKWGFTFAYTWSQARQQGGDLFSLDYGSVADYPRSPTPGDELHHIVASAIVALPWDLRLSGLMTLGSGVGYTILDFSNGFGINEKQILYNTGRPDKKDFIFPDAFAYRDVDLRIEKVFALSGKQNLGVAIDAFNVFDFRNYGCFDGFKASPGFVNPNFGKPGCQLDPGRRVQVGMTYAF